MVNANGVPASPSREEAAMADWWRAFLEFESFADVWLDALVIMTVLLGGLAGWAVCQLTHRQRGIEVDRPVTDVLPLPPPPVVVPDTVPEDWMEPEEVESVD